MLTRDLDAEHRCGCIVVADIMLQESPTNCDRESFASPVLAITLIALSSLVVYHATAVWTWLRAAWILRKLPNGSGNPFFGGLRKVLTFNRMREMQKLNETVLNGAGACYFNVLWRQFVVITDPRLLSQLLHDKSLHKPVEPDYAHFQQLMGPDKIGDLVASSGDQDDWLWKAVRKGVAPAFAPHALRAVYPKVQAKAAELVRTLSVLSKDDEAVDMAYALMCETMDVLGLAGFDKSYHNLENLSNGKPAKILDVIRSANAEVCRKLQNPLYEYYLKLPGSPTAGQAKIEEFHGIMSDLLAEVKARGPPADEDSSIAAQLMRVQDPRTGKPLADKYLLPQFSVLFWAGFDTTGNTMTWTLFLISQHPEVEKKITEELAEVGLLATTEKPEAAMPEYGDLAKLTYLSCVIKEAMRMYTVPGMTTVRQSKGRDVVLNDGKLVIPRDVPIFMPIGALHRSHAVFEKADQFIPERWLRADADYLSGDPTGSKLLNGQSSPDKVLRFMPFSDGTRQCVGMALAKMNYTAILAHLIGNFSFRLATRMGGVDGVLKAQKYEILLTPSTGMWMHCNPRAS